MQSISTVLLFLSIYAQAKAMTKIFFSIIRPFSDYYSDNSMTAVSELGYRLVFCPNLVSYLVTR